MTTDSSRRLTSSVLFLLIFALAGPGGPATADESTFEGESRQPVKSAAQRDASQQTKAPVLPSLPLLLAEGSNSCEIVSCGMGIKQTCQITCPAGKTPKCSCDCEKSFGPMCMDYKANCRCE